MRRGGTSATIETLLIWRGWPGTRRSIAARHPPDEAGGSWAVTQACRGRAAYAAALLQPSRLRTSSAVLTASRPISWSRFAGFLGAGPQTLTTAMGYSREFSTAAEAPEENSSYSRVQSA